MGPCGQARRSQSPVATQDARCMRLDHCTRGFEQLQVFGIPMDHDTEHKSEHHVEHRDDNENAGQDIGHCKEPAMSEHKSGWWRVLKQVGTKSGCKRSPWRV